MTISIKSENDIHYAQHEGVSFAQNIGMETLDTTKVSIIISELAHNIIKYAQKGFVRFSKVNNEFNVGILVEAIDNGPAIEDIERALKDNYSTGGSLGLGLPGIKRISDELHISSSKGKGTHIKVTYWKK
ncbi:ATP-binding protein [Flammeovirga aprica]|uniref:Anti-sigma regulatory factor n=1 Tax=Flammeovirga aprica JL-4 TaxID=694437 RepID=A0A7X9RVV2_9BACT|nr:ATP-binding protein [Flammeovirga aprica]NME69646.1 anti-sigma regulatory factor [Flammeovirga aprica JL-4]